MKLPVYLLWALRLVAAAILLQTLYFKFTAQPESVEIFTKLGVEPWGRIGSGVVELIAGALLLWTPLVGLGAFLGMGTMSGAIFSHLTVLGIESHGDGGQLFILACVVWVCCAVLVWVNKGQLLALVGRK